jgi:uncharacterized phage protein (TIGR02220 family)
MSLEERGAYITLLCFQADKGYLKEDDILKKIPADLWTSISPKFEKDKLGFYNKRLRDEVLKRREYSKSRQRNRMKKDMLNTCKTYVPHMVNANANANANANRDVNSKEIGGMGERDYAKEIEEILNHLNNLISSNYKINGKKTREMIITRLKEGFTVDDFKTVHRKKVEEWGLDQKMRTFLRPITLYSNKFESYLNQPDKIRHLTEAQRATIESQQRWQKKMEEEENAKRNIPEGN